MKTDRPSPGYFYYTQKILFPQHGAGSLPGKFVGPWRLGRSIRSL